MAVTRSNICTVMTRLYSKTSGVPRSVNAQINTMTDPANRPGIIRGSVILRNSRRPLDPMFLAASSSEGSTLASAAETFRYMMGYRWSTCRMTTPQNRPPPSQSMGEEVSPASMSSRLMEPNLARNCRMPMAPTNGGMIIGTSSRPVSRPLAGKEYRTVTNASGIASAAVSTVAVIPSRKLFSSDSRVMGLAKMLPKKLSENSPPGKNASRNT